MNELYNAIREAVETHFDKKLRRSDYINNQEVWDIVEEAITNLQDMAYEYNAKVDDFIEEQEADYMSTREEMRNAYDQFRQDELS